MSSLKIFKKIVIPCAAGVTSAGDGHTYGKNCAQKTEQGTKPSDLPIYSKQCKVCENEKEEVSTPTSMEECVGNIRKELWVWQDNLKGYRHKIVDVYQKGFSKADCPERTDSRNHLDACDGDDKCFKPPSCSEIRSKTFKPSWCETSKFERLYLDRCGRPCSGGQHAHHPNCNKHRPPQTKPSNRKPQVSECDTSLPPCEGSQNEPVSVIDYLREPAHGPQRIGAIFISGLAGYIMGMRYCGKMRRIMYGAGGATTMSAICYPKEAADYLETLVLQLRKYFIVAYHFVYGENPKMPEWLEDFVGSKGKKTEVQLETAKPDDALNLDVQKILGTEEKKNS